MSGAIFLVGLPGCGKSTLGRSAAQAAGRPFADVDEEIVREHGPILDIFQRGGEALFRPLESAALERLCQLPGAVISCGGGIILREQNVASMKAAGRIVFLDRPLEAILGDILYAERPLLKGGKASLRALAEVRLPLYRACADATIANDGTFEQARDAILSLLEEEP